MQIGSVNTAVTAMLQPKSGNNLPPEAEKISKAQTDSDFVRQLAGKIDPANMSRNDAWAIGDALAQNGDSELAMTFLAQGMIMVEENGEMRTAGPDDAIMNEKFDMFASLTEQIAFHKSKGLPTERLEKAFHFLEKMSAAGNSTSINLYT